MGCTGSKPATKAEKTLMVESAAKSNGDNTGTPVADAQNIKHAETTDEKNNSGSKEVADASVAMELTDQVVTLAPYFKLKDVEKFKSIWQEDYKNFAHKADCVHYAFCFTEDNRAHCREAYPNAEKVLQHLADVDAPFNAVLDGPAELERLEVHGPKAEVDKLRDALSSYGCLFYVTEWGFRVAKGAMEEDTVCHLYPYFQLKEPEQFRKIWSKAYPDTKANAEAEKSHQYAFSFEPTANVASCRESYGDADGILQHLKNVDGPLKTVLDGPADLLRLEVHAPASEIEKLKPALEPLGCQFFTTGWGFRNAVVPESQQSFAASAIDAKPAPESQQPEQAAGTAAQSQATGEQSAQPAMPQHDQAASDPVAQCGVAEAVEKPNDGKLMVESGTVKDTTELETVQQKGAEGEAAGQNLAEVVASVAEQAGQTGPPADESQAANSEVEDKKAGAVETSGNRSWCCSKYCHATEAQNEFVVEKE